MQQMTRKVLACCLFICRGSFKCICAGKSTKGCLQEGCPALLAVCIGRLSACCSAVAATPDMKTLIAAGSDKKIKEMEDNSVCLTHKSAYQPCTMQSSRPRCRSALLSVLLRTDAWQPHYLQAPASLVATPACLAAAHMAFVVLVRAAVLARVLAHRSAGSWTHRF
jgi:hypothetical protein